MGFDLYPSFIALMQFGDRWLSRGERAPLTLIHATCGCDSHPVVTCSHCGESVCARDAKYRDGPGAGRCPAKEGRNTRRASDGGRFLLGRPSSVSRALEIIGDKWSFMVVREGFFGNRTDFIRTAIRRQLETRSSAVDRTVARRELVLGTEHYNRHDLEALRDSGRMVELRVLGLASIADDVSPAMPAALVAPTTPGDTSSAMLANPRTRNSTVRPLSRHAPRSCRRECSGPSTS